jgi:hypothetical protein
MPSLSLISLVIICSSWNSRPFSMAVNHMWKTLRMKLSMSSLPPHYSSRAHRRPREVREGTATILDEASHGV